MYYPTVYTDEIGSERTVIYNNGKTLALHLRKVRFIGYEFDSLEPVENISKENLTKFTLFHNFLCDCTIECIIPLIISRDIDEDTFGTLKMRLVLGKPDDRNALDKEDLYLSLFHKGKSYETEANLGDFENGLLSLNECLPKPLYIKSCITCQYSDYSPYGMGMFGTLACFREIKEKYLELGKDGDIKREVLCLWDQMTEYVQEIHLCEEYDKRIPGTGYRG